MKFSETGISGVWLIEPEPITDSRGSFTRLYCPDEFAAVGIDFQAGTGEPVAKFGRPLL